MKTGNKFTGKIFCVEGDRFYPAKHMTENYKSIVDAWYYDTSDLNGNWKGWIIQKIGKTYNLIAFEQAAWGHCGYSVETFDVIYYDRDLEECKKKADEIVRKYENVSPKAASEYNVYVGGDCVWEGNNYVEALRVYNECVRDFPDETIDLYEVDESGEMISLEGIN